MTLVFNSPEFNFSATLVNSQLVCLLPVGILNLVMFIWIFIYHCLFTLVLENPNGEWPIIRKPGKAPAWWQSFGSYPGYPGIPYADLTLPFTRITRRGRGLGREPKRVGGGGILKVGGRNRWKIATLSRGSPIPLCKTQSRKNISPFHASRIISKILSRAREIRDDHVSHKNNIFTSCNLSIKVFILRVWLFHRVVT